MNRQLIESYIESYKTNFVSVHRQEIYKWKAVKCFQDNWQLNASDFHKMLEKSLSKVINLLDSGQYFPKRMLLKNAEKSPAQIKELFQDLFDESTDLLSRISNFQDSFNRINNKNYPGKQSYQDHRAIIVYLTLQYPENYYIYKFTVFQKFSNLIEYHYIPIGGRIENVGHFQNLCDLVKYELIQDQALLKLHKDRIKEDCYFDSNYNLLTQDFIYACTTYFSNNTAKSSKQSKYQQGKISTIDSSKLNTSSIRIDFKPTMINFIQREIENKRIGDLGELWVVEFEKYKLLNRGIKNISDKIKHVSKEKGDGTGFDIKSVDEYGKEIFIEVKTTTGNFNTPFFITRQELERSLKEKNKYYLYRLYNFDYEKNKGDLLIINGELTKYCQSPWTFKTSIEKNKA